MTTPNPHARNLLGIDPQALEERIALRREILAGKGERLAKLKARTEGNAGSGTFPGVLTDAGNGLVTIRICGEMAPERDDWLTYLGVQQAVYSELIPACDTAAGNPLVRGVLLDIDSPGGAVEGFEDFFLALQRLTAAKPCVGIARCCASLGIFASFALATENLAAVNDGRLGSIGIMYDMEDSSKAYEMMGIRRVIVASGKNKGTHLGAAGLPITPEMEENVMAVLVAPTFARFKAAAIAARGLADNSPVFDGRVLTPAEALGFGLIGKTGTTDDIQRWAGERLAALIAEQDDTMSDDKSKNRTEGQNPPAPKPGDAPAGGAKGSDAPAGGAVGAATLDELEAEFGDEPKFVLDSLKGKLTMADAAKGYAKLQKEKLRGATEQLTAVRGELATAQANKTPGTPGNKRVDTALPGTGGAGGAKGSAGDVPDDTGVASDYEARLAELKGSMGGGKAVAQAQKEMPKGYAAWRKAKGLG